MADILLNVSPGLIIWTLINFGLFFLILAKFGFKPMLASLQERENSISTAISEAEKINADARALLQSSQEKMASVQAEMMDAIKHGKEQAEQIVRRAQDEADRVKKARVEDAIREINREKENAMLSLRSEVAALVVAATGKILKETLDSKQHSAIAERYIEQISKN